MDDVSVVVGSDPPAAPQPAAAPAPPPSPLESAQPPGNPQPLDDPSLPNALGMLKRHWLLMAGCVAAMVAPVAAYIVMTTPVYEATTSIRIEEEQASMAGFLNPMAAASDISTEMAVLESWTLAEDVAASTGFNVRVVHPVGLPREALLTDVTATREAAPGLYELRRMPGDSFVVSGVEGVDSNRVPAAELAEVPIAGAQLRLTAAAAERDRLVVAVLAYDDAVAELSRNIRITRPNRDANIVVVKYRSTDPSLARDVANGVAHRFIDLRQDTRTLEARSTAAFLREQLASVSRQLGRAERDLRRFRERYRVVSPAIEASSQVMRLVQLQAERRGLEAERSSLAELMTEIERASRTTDPDATSPYRRLAAFPTLLQNQPLSDLLRALNVVEDQRRALLVRRTEEDPEVGALSERKADLERQVRALGETYLGSISTQVRSLDAALIGFGAELQQIPAKEIEFARLQREPQVLEEMYTLLQTRLKEAEIAEAVQDPTVRVVDPARLPRRPVQPRPALYLFGSVVGGLLLGGVATVARERMDRTVHTTDDVRVAAGLPVMGFIPRLNLVDVRPASNGSMALQRSSQSFAMLPAAPAMGVLRNGARRQARKRAELEAVAGEAYGTFFMNLAFSNPDRQLRLLVFTSPLPGDGKTTSAMNLAMVLARRGARPLLIDADLRRGVLHRALGLSADVGLADILLGRATLAQAVRRVPVGDGQTIGFLSTGGRVHHPTTAFGGATMTALFAEARRDYAVVIVDTPPINVVPDAGLLGQQADGVVVVARAGITETDALAHAMDQLRTLRAPVLGVLLNDINFRREARYDSAYRYYGQAYSYTPNGD